MQRRANSDISPVHKLPVEWSYEAQETDVRAETLEKAAQLLVLRRDTFRIIDGAGPSLDAPPLESTEQGNGSGTQSE